MWVSRGSLCRMLCILSSLMCSFLILEHDDDDPLLHSHSSSARFSLLLTSLSPSQQQHEPITGKGHQAD